MTDNTILLATGNQGKIRELKLLLEPLGVNLKGLSDMAKVPEPEEPFLSFEENALHKAWYYFHAYRIPVLAEDSGLSVDALDGAPGVFSARYAGEPCVDGNNNTKLLADMERFTEPAQRTARYVAVLCFQAGTIAQSFRGSCEGTIDFACSGSNGFGYDVLFMPQGQDKTFGVLDPAFKKGLSHRSQAVKQFVGWWKDREPESAYKSAR